MTLPQYLPGAGLSTAEPEEQIRWPRVLVLGAILLSWFFVPVVGQLYPAELVALAAIPFLAPRIVQRDKLRPLVALGSLGVAAILTSSWINDSPGRETLKEALNAALAASDIAFVYLAATHVGESIALALTLALAGRFGGLWLLGDAPEVLVNPWKFGGGMAVTAVVLAMSWRMGLSRTRLACVLMALAVADVVAFDSRSLALLTIAVAVLACCRRTARADADASGSASMVLWVALGSAAAVAVTFYAYVYLAGRGLLSQSAAARLAAQNGSSPMSLLLSGRKELTFSLRAIWERPLLGYGSQPLLTSPILNWATEFLHATGYRFTAADYRAWHSNSEIPTHSAVFGAWVRGGLAGAAVWLWIARSLTSRAASLLAGHGAYVELRLFLLLTAIWSVFLSPLGGENRMLVAVCVAVPLAPWGSRESRATPAGLPQPAQP